MNDQLIQLAIAAGLPSLGFGVFGWLLKRSIGEIDRSISRFGAQMDELFKANSARDISVARLEMRLEAAVRRLDNLERVA